MCVWAAVTDATLYYKHPLLPSTLNIDKESNVDQSQVCEYTTFLLPHYYYFYYYHCYCRALGVILILPPLFRFSTIIQSL